MALFGLFGKKDKKDKVKAENAKSKAVKNEITDDDGQGGIVILPEETNPQPVSP